VLHPAERRLPKECLQQGVSLAVDRGWLGAQVLQNKWNSSKSCAEFNLDTASMLLYSCNTNPAYVKC
jgi:hypothetical protein